MSAWSAQLYCQFYTGPNCGIVSMGLNGSAVPNFTIDLYSPIQQLSPVIALPPGVVAGSNQLTLTVVGKNAVSTGYDVKWAHVSVVPNDGLNLGVTPGTSTKFWTALSPGTISDVDTIRNWLTDGQAYWNLKDPAGVINARPDNSRASATAMQWGTIPFGATVGGSSSPGAGNSSTYALPSSATGSNSVALYTGGGVQAGYWNQGPGAAIAQTYRAGQPAALGYYTGEQKAIYTALNYTQGDYPATSPTKWKITSLANNLTYEPSVVQNQTIPLGTIPVWYPYTSYNFRDVVSWNGHLYQAAQATRVNAPTGYDTDNPWWRWLGPDIELYTFSVYHYRTATGAGQNVRAEIDWFDQNGAYISNAVVRDSRQLLLDRFEVDNLAYPASSGAAPTGWTTPQPWQQGTGIPWECDWGLWNSNNGMGAPLSWTKASGTSTATNQSIMQAGRALFFKRDWVYSGVNADIIYTTFRSRPVDTSGVSGGPFTMEHGIAFRYGNGQYFLASRDRLTYAQLTYDANGQPTGALSGANLIVLATWQPITDGTRMRVRVNSSQITVETLTPLIPGWVQLATISGNTTNNSANGMGFLERIRP
jgi:hypothetical protein